MSSSSRLTKLLLGHYDLKRFQKSPKDSRKILKDFQKILRDLKKTTSVYKEGGGLRKKHIFIHANLRVLSVFSLHVPKLDFNLLALIQLHKNLKIGEITVSIFCSTSIWDGYLKLHVVSKATSVHKGSG